jgi:hypothetical protein
VRRQRWSAPRALALLLIGCVWIATGVGVYLYLGAHRSTLASQAQRPDAGAQARDAPIKRLAGTLYLIQDGTLYRLQSGVFTAILKAPGGSAVWTQPAISPSGQSLVVVRRDYAYSDLYLLDASGHVQSQLTHDASRTVELNHWALYPRFTADGRTLFLNYDPKDFANNYNVVLAVWSMPLGSTQMRKWTTPEGYTGGDVQPFPLATGGVVYTKYTFDTAVNKVMGQIWLTTRAGSVGRPLTAAADDCSQPALSPNGQRLAMVCTGGTQFANIAVASFDGVTLGPRQVVVAGQLAAQPTWAPDGNSLVYLAAQGITGHFQLWLQQIPPPPPPPTTLPTPIPTRPASPPQGARVARPTATPAAPATPTPTPIPLPPPVQLTSNLNFDATSSIAWHS